MKFFLSTLVPVAAAAAAFAQESNVSINGVPDYHWHAGCFGSASGNLIGYWDRNGFPNFYTGPTAGGVAPLDSYDENVGIRSLWASQAGFDGRPIDMPGHMDDYWEFYVSEHFSSYESTAPDPYLTLGRPEHAADCIGDFTGASQNKWTDLGGECSGNIDAFAFNFWDKSGGRRTNYIPASISGLEVRDLQSGLLKWTEFRGRSATVISQLVDFNPETPVGSGFTFADLKAEIDAGYPVMLFLQFPKQFSRSKPGMPRANPVVHGMVADGYFVRDSGEVGVRYRTSWGEGERYSKWSYIGWEAGLTLRGVIMYHPHPHITRIEQTGDAVRIEWDGPSSVLNIDFEQGSEPVHKYVLERADSLTNPNWLTVSEQGTSREREIAACCGSSEGYFRVVLVE